MILNPVIVGEPKTLSGGQNYNWVHDPKIIEELKEIKYILKKFLTHIETISEEKI